MIVPPPPPTLMLGLIQGASAVADTVVTISASSTGLQRWVDLMTSIASIVIAVVLIVIAVSLVPAAWNSRRLYRRVNKLLDHLQDRSEPIAQHARSIADNVDYVSSAVRADVERLQITVTEAQTRLTHAAEMAEERIAQFNALLEVVQEEAESLFIDTAATVHGVRAGVRTMQEDHPTRRAREAPTEIDVVGPPPRPRRHP